MKKILLSLSMLSILLLSGCSASQDIQSNNGFPPLLSPIATMQIVSELDDQETIQRIEKYLESSQDYSTIETFMSSEFPDNELNFEYIKVKIEGNNYIVKSSGYPQLNELNTNQNNYAVFVSIIPENLNSEMQEFFYIEETELSTNLKASKTMLHYMNNEELIGFEIK